MQPAHMGGEDFLRTYHPDIYTRVVLAGNGHGDWKTMNPVLFEKREIVREPDTQTGSSLMAYHRGLAMEQIRDAENKLGI